MKLAAYASCFALSYLSALFPFVNAEIVLLSFVTAAGSGREAALTFAAIVSVGQMAGKATMYVFGRGVAKIPSERQRRLLERWEARFHRSPRAVMFFVFLSAVTGIPPFYVVSILAGTFSINFIAFVAVGLAGRLLRFGSLAFFPAALGHLRNL